MRCGLVLQRSPLVVKGQSEAPTEGETVGLQQPQCKRASHKLRNVIATCAAPSSAITVDLLSRSKTNNGLCLISTELYELQQLVFLCHFNQERCIVVCCRKTCATRSLRLELRTANCPTFLVQPCLR